MRTILVSFIETATGQEIQVARQLCTFVHKDWGISVIMAGFSSFPSKRTAAKYWVNELDKSLNKDERTK